MRLLLSFVFACALTSFAAEPPQSGKLMPRVDINNAPRETIETLPGVGPKLAQEIIAGRPYKTIDELDKVKGIGAKKLQQLRPRVMILPMRADTVRELPKTNIVLHVNINTATQADLEKLPGIGPKRAEAIIAARPFQRPEDLLRVPGIKRAEFEKIKGQVAIR
jgi:competence ComEA-like helix-hairpin-helix protein